MTAASPSGSLREGQGGSERGSTPQSRVAARLPLAQSGPVTHLGARRLDREPLAQRPLSHNNSTSGERRKNRRLGVDSYLHRWGPSQRTTDGRYTPSGVRAERLIKNLQRDGQVLRKAQGHRQRGGSLPCLGLKGPEEDVDSSTHNEGCLMDGNRSPSSRNSAIATTQEGSRVKSPQPGPQPHTYFLLWGCPVARKRGGSLVRCTKVLGARTVGRGRGRRKQGKDTCHERFVLQCEIELDWRSS